MYIRQHKPEYVHHIPWTTFRSPYAISPPRQLEIWPTETPPAARVHPITVTNQSTQLDKSLQMQNSNIQDIDDDNRPSSEHKIYHFHNCRMMDSFNTRTITMEKCGNKNPQVANCSSYLFSRIFVLI